MDLSKHLKYNKEAGSHEPSAPKDVSAKKPSSQDHPAPKKTLPSSNEEYVKGKYIADAKLLFIISGGTNRERDYFLQFDKSRTNQNVKIVFASKDGQGLTPTQMVSVLNAAVEDSQFWDYKDREYYFGGDDEVFMVQDMDLFHDEILKAQQKCSEDIPEVPVHWMVSNPCFELWLYYHYFDSPLQLSILQDVSIEHRSQRLKKILPTLKVGGLQAAKCFPLLETAITNSRSNYVEEAGGLPALFSTNMHVMAQYILQSMSVPFAAIVEQVTKRTSMFLEQLKKK